MSASPAPPPASAPAAPVPLGRLLVAPVVLGAAGFGAIWLGMAAAGFGRDVHPFRVLVAVGVMLPFLLLVVWPKRKPAVRVGAGILAITAGVLAWWHAPCWPGGTNLLAATVKRDALKAQIGSVTFEDIKRAGDFQHGFDDLAKEYPTLADSVRPELARWADSAADLVVERFKQTPPDDLAAAREARSRSLTLGKAFPDQSKQLDAEFRAWVTRAAKARAAELNAVPPTDWDEFNRTATARHALARAFPESRGELLAAERVWVTKSGGQVTADAIQALEGKPREARKLCRDADKQIDKLKTLDTSPDRFRVARGALFAVAHEAARVEVHNHIVAEAYGLAFTAALGHDIEWLATTKMLGPEEQNRTAELRELARHLAVRFEKAGGPPEPAPEPRTRETAPPPRSKD